MNQLAKFLLVSRNGLAVMTSAVMLGCLTVEGAKAQPQLSCFMLDTYGEVISLADICDTKPQFQVKSRAVERIDRNLHSGSTSESKTSAHPPVETVFSVGNGSVPFILGTSSALYYSGQPLVYVRRYRQTPRARFMSRNESRDGLLGAANTRRVKFSGRNPFIIYRYQK